ncbi:MAG TPA: hypothetical protein PLY97_08655 [Acidocella sp.]|nr:hypothetical protein [Acidocella sp.]
MIIADNAEPYELSDLFREPLKNGLRNVENTVERHISLAERRDFHRQQV